MNDELRNKLAEKDAEIERLKVEFEIQYGFRAKAESERDELRQQLAAAQTEAGRMLVEQDADYNRKTNALIARHAEQLVANNAEIERLREEVRVTKEVEFPRKAEAVANNWRTKLAAAQAREQQYRGAMSEVEQKYRALLEEKDAEAESFKAEGDMYGWNFHTGVRSGAVEMHLNLTKLMEAIAQPSDTSALEAMIAKAGEVMRWRTLCAYSPDMLANDWIDAIRALPGVTLEDLK